MEIVIDIDKFTYLKLFKEQIAPTLQDLDKCFLAIKNGKAMPTDRNRGRLIDANELYNLFAEEEVDHPGRTWTMKGVEAIIDDASTIIE